MKCLVLGFLPSPLHLSVLGCMVIYSFPGPSRKRVSWFLGQSGSFPSCSNLLCQTWTSNISYSHLNYQLPSLSRGIPPASTACFHAFAATVANFCSCIYAGELKRELHATSVERGHPTSVGFQPPSRLPRLYGELFFVLLNLLTSGPNSRVPALILRKRSGSNQGCGRAFSRSDCAT